MMKLMIITKTKKEQFKKKHSSKEECDSVITVFIDRCRNCSNFKKDGDVVRTPDMEKCKMAK